jgi:hypothetical protein
MFDTHGSHFMVTKATLIDCRPATNAVLEFAIRHIILVSANKQMVRIDAQRVITAVTNEQALGNLALVQHV